MTEREDSNEAGPLGFIGLGNMGGPMAANLAAAGTALVVHDAAGTQARAPEGATLAASNAQVAAACEVVVLSLPDGGAVRSVARELASAPDSRVRVVVDTSTIGIAAARAVHSMLLDKGIEYVDSPVSGGVSGARKATIAVMMAGDEKTVEALRPRLAPMAANLFRVGDRAGQAQAMKVLNNFLSGTAMAATSEAIAFGVSQGLDMKTMLDVLNVSSGQNTATADKFPNRILSGSYDAGFTSRLFLKDLLLFREAALEAGQGTDVSRAVTEIWRRLEQAEPNVDMTRVYPFVAERRFEHEGEG